MCLCIFGICIISVVVAQINSTATDSVCGKIDSFSRRSFGAYPHRRDVTGGILKWDVLMTYNNHDCLCRLSVDLS